MKIGDRENDSNGGNDPYPFGGYTVYGAIKFYYETAERANVDLQRFSAIPIDPYVDAVYRCATCSVEFLFTASEQRYWYETRKFYVGCYPRNCLQCRRKLRSEREQQLSLQQKYNAEIKATLRRDADLEMKESMLRVIDELVACSNTVGESMKRNRRVLSVQIFRRKHPDYAG